MLHVKAPGVTASMFLSAKTMLVRYILVPGYEAPEERGHVFSSCQVVVWLGHPYSEWSLGKFELREDLEYGIVLVSNKISNM